MSEKITLDWVKKSNAAALTRQQVAELFDCDARTISRGIEDGSIPSIKLGRRVLIPREQLLALLVGPQVAA
jgi:excisionase family DNA binding protein